MPFLFLEWYKTRIILSKVIIYAMFTNYLFCLTNTHQCCKRHFANSFQQLWWCIAFLLCAWRTRELSQALRSKMEIYSRMSGLLSVSAYMRESECDANYSISPQSQNKWAQRETPFFPILLYSNQICKSSRVTHITKVCAAHSFGLSVLILYSHTDIPAKKASTAQFIQTAAGREQFFM